MATEYQTPQEVLASNRLRVSENTLYKLLNAGRISGAVRVGREWRIPATAEILPAPEQITTTNRNSAYPDWW